MTNWTIEKGSNLEQTLCDALAKNALATGTKKAILLDDKHPGISYEFQMGVGKDQTKVVYTVADEHIPGKISLKRWYILNMNGQRVAYKGQDYQLSQDTQTINRDTTARSK